MTWCYDWAIIWKCSKLERTACLYFKSNTNPFTRLQKEDIFRSLVHGTKKKIPKIVIVTILESGSHCDLNEYCDCDNMEYHKYEQTQTPSIALWIVLVEAQLLIERVRY